MSLFILGLLGAVGLVGFADIFGGNDDAEAEPETTDLPVDTGPITPELPVEDADVGASIIENEDGSLHVELGDDETGSVVAIKFKESGVRGDYGVDYSLGLFLVPEGSEIPLDTTGETHSDQSFDELFAGFGLTELASFDLGTLDGAFNYGTGEPLSDNEDTRIEPPLITSDDPIEIFRMHKGYQDGGHFILRTQENETFSTFEPWGSYHNGVERVETTTNYTGTDETDYVRADGPAGTAGVTLTGLGDDDYLVSYLDDSHLSGGEGNDYAFAFGANSTAMGGEGNDGVSALGDGSVAMGGAGNDTIAVGPNSTAYGGEGDDSLDSYTNGTNVDLHGNLYEIDGPVDNGSQLYGGAGEDYLTLDNAAATGHGGVGNDTLVVSNGASGFGDAGNDFFNISAGAIADGGDGDDRFQMVARVENAGEGAALLTGGAGADVYEFSLNSVSANSTEQYMEITDFDPAEDVLQISGWDIINLGDVRVEEATDGSYTDVIAEFAHPSISGALMTAIVRLDGVSGYTVSDLVA